MRIRSSFCLTAAIAASLVSAMPSARADVRLPHIFGNQMVLQRDLPIRVWGFADPNEQVTVTIDEKHTGAVTADAEGKWKLELPPIAATGAAVEINVRGKNAITLRDVLVGEVWVCSGQSNMQWSVSSSTNAKEEIAAAKYPKIRLFHVPMRPAGEPAADVDAAWKECTPDYIPSFSAVAYFFGRHLHKALDVPVGLINTSWGGTRIEPWTPPVGFSSVPALAPTVAEIEKQQAAYRKSTGETVDRIAAWLPAAQKAKAEGQPIPQVPAWPAHPLSSNALPTGLYNGMVHPLVPFAIRGAIWYQGESNLADGMLYHEKMKALINGWRAVWQEGDFPFYFVQLASFKYGSKRETPALPLLWEAQSAALTVPNTGMAVTNDISTVGDIHPKNKQDVGKRLALWALAKTYGKNVVYSGPTYQSMTLEGSKVRLKFDQVGGGLVARDGKPLSWFSIAGEDKKFVDAEAAIDGGSVVVSAAGVDKPAAVRFGWSDIAEPNLSNKEGLPASAFRTDRW